MSFFIRKTRPATGTRSPSRTCRPQLETLEDRSVPSAGFLDTTFGSGGIVTTGISNGSADDARAVLVQPDGKLVAAGGRDFAMVRYNPSGSLDTSFGSGGKVSTSLGTAGGARAAALYPAGTANAGKIVLGGFAGKASSSGSWDFALARYNANGTLDTSFGNRGKVVTDFGGHYDEIDSIALQSDGKIVVAGMTLVPGSSTNGYQFALARYNNNGTLDSSFGSGGKVITKIASGDEWFNAVAIQPDGKIVAAGYAGGIYYPGVSEIVVARYTSTGVLDTDSTAGFGPIVSTTGQRTGFAVPYWSGEENAYALALQPDGMIVVAGQTDTVPVNSGAHFVLARFNSAGSLDATFGNAGKVATQVSSYDWAWGLALQPNGKIIASGTANNGSGSGFNGFALARYNVNGSLDDGSVNDSTPGDSFGTAGKTIIVIGSGGNGSRAVALQSDGKIVSAGFSYNGSDFDFTLARYQGDSPLQAASAAAKPTATILAASQVQPLLNEAISRWQATGVDVSGLRNLDIRIMDLGGTYLGIASGHTIWLDDNAAGWGWFVDRTPRSDSEFTTPGNQGEKNRMDLLSVVTHELGHLIGFDHDDAKDDVMGVSLVTGIRRMPKLADRQTFAAPIVVTAPVPTKETEGTIRPQAPIEEPSHRTRRRAEPGHIPFANVFLGGVAVDFSDPFDQFIPTKLFRGRVR